MKVALDLEDVLVETNSMFIEELNRFIKENHPESEVQLSVSDVDGWLYDGIREPLAELQGWKKEDDDVELFFSGDDNGWPGFHPMTEGIWNNNPERYQPVRETIKEEVSELREVVEEKGGELYLVTARQNANEAVRKRLEQLEIKQYFEDVVFKVSKDELDFDIYIDDYPHLYSKLENGVHIMINQPWNEQQALEPPHQRVKDLREAIEVVKNL